METIYLSLIMHTGSWGYLFHEIPSVSPSFYSSFFQIFFCLLFLSIYCCMIFLSIFVMYGPSLENCSDQLSVTLYTLSIYPSVLCTQSADPNHFRWTASISISVYLVSSPYPPYQSFVSLVHNLLFSFFSVLNILFIWIHSLSYLLSVI